MTYDEALYLLERAKKKHRDFRNLAKNTWVALNDDGRPIIHYGSADIITFYRGGSILVDTGSWFTHMTRTRLNEYLPYGYRVWQENGLFYMKAGALEGAFYGPTVRVVRRNDKVVRAEGLSFQPLKYLHAVERFINRYLSALFRGKISENSKGWKEQLKREQLYRKLENNTFTADLVCDAMGRHNNAFDTISAFWKEEQERRRVPEDDEEACRWVEGRFHKGSYEEPGERAILRARVEAKLALRRHLRSLFSLPYQEQRQHLRTRFR